MSYDFDLCLTFDLDIGVKNVMYLSKITPPRELSRFKPTFFFLEELLTRATYGYFTDKRSKVIKVVISGMKAKNSEKYSKIHYFYKLHSRVTSLAHMGF